MVQFVLKLSIHVKNDLQSTIVKKPVITGQSCPTFTLYG